MPLTTRAAVLEGTGQRLRIRDITLTDPAPREVLVRTVSTGICGTDIHFANGLLPYPLPTVLGHEAAGTVEAVGDGDHGITVGTRVIVCDQTFCGHCPSCLSGQMVYCADPGTKRRQSGRLALGDQPMRQYLGVSSFAELMLVDAHSLIPMPDALSFDAAALLSCCLTTGLAAVFNIACPAPGSRVAIIGCGGVGLGAVQAARIAGAAQIIAVDPKQHRRVIATRLGATDTIDPEQDDPVAAVIEASGGGVDRAVEAVGLPTTAVQAFSVLLPGGHATVLGMMPPGTDVALPGRLLRQGRTIGGTVMGSVRTLVDIPRYADLAVRGQLRTDDLITSRRSLAEVNAALADASAHHGVRAVLAF